MLHALTDESGNSIPIDENITFFKDWNAVSSTILTERGPLTVKWRNLQKLAASWLIQTNGAGSGEITIQNFFKNFDAYHNKIWNVYQNFNVFDDLPDSPVIVDVGSGASILDMFLYQYLQDSAFYLVDNTTWDLKNIQNVKGTLCWKHDWSIAKDAILSSDYDKSRFNFLTPATDWNFKSDVVLSSMAWGMHFPLTDYWNKCYNSLKVGGKLILDVNPHWYKSFTEKIDDEFGYKHQVLFSFSEKMTKFNKFDQYVRIAEKFPDLKLEFPSLESNIVASKCLWIRKK